MKWEEERLQCQSMVLWPTPRCHHPSNMFGNRDCYINGRKCSVKGVKLRQKTVLYAEACKCVIVKERQRKPSASV